MPKLRILYITRDLGYSYSLRRTKKFHSRWYRPILTGLHYVFRKTKGCLYHYGIDGFFEASLNLAGKVDSVSYSKVKYLSRITGYDIVVFHLRSVETSISGNQTELVRLASIVEGRSCLYINHDQAEFMPLDNVLDHFDIVFKREPFRDLSRYNLSDKNKSKIRPTMLSCHVLLLPKHRLPLIPRQIQAIKQRSRAKQYELFFLGQTTDRRIEVLSAIKRYGIKITGGLLPRYGMTQNEDLTAKSMPFNKYIQYINESKVNLAIDGHGQFTFRHLELLATMSFMISSNTINSIWLPFEIQAGKDYVTFDNEKDLTAKIKYYLSHQDERNEIAANGYSCFINGYSIYRHAEYIREVFAKL